MKRSFSKKDFILTVLFVGIVLSGTLFFGITMRSDQLHGDVNDSVIGEHDTGVFEPVYRAVYGNSELDDIIKKVSYALFHEIENENFIVGSDGFIFEIRSDDYDYLLDYMGETPFSDEELQTIASNIGNRRQMFENAGKRYILAVIPNSVRIYSDCLPLHYGKPSDNSRLSQLSTLMGSDPSYIDLTRALTEAKSRGYVYNNTEDSVNALGAYVIYRAVADRINDGAVLCGEEDLRFYTHLTPGKSATRRAGVADIVKNRTVSYTDDYKLTFKVGSRDGDPLVYTQTKRNFVADVSGESLVIAVDPDAGMYQLMPFFSNAYGYVTYVSSVSGMTVGYGGDTVIEFVTERNLASLIDMNDIALNDIEEVNGSEKT